MQAELAKINSLSQKDKVRLTLSLFFPTATDSLHQTQACVTLLSSTLTTSTTLVPDLSLYLDTILAQDFPQIVARQALSDYVARLKEIKDHEVKKQVMADSLGKIQPRVTTFEEQVSTLSLCLEAVVVQERRRELTH